ncbi:MAG: DUF1287 domain-containing protein [Hyphomicrobiales bacterium]
MVRSFFKSMIAGVAALVFTTLSSHADELNPEWLISAAVSQVGKTIMYDPAYVKLAYPMGDIARKRGVCTDVVIRAYRDAYGVDLQKLVHEDMKRAFQSYPKIWGHKRTDKNIDHRRVPNLRAFFQRIKAALPVTDNAGDYKPGDLVTQMVGGKLPHIGIVSNQMSTDGKRPLVIHNIGAGTRVEDTLFAFPITGHYRFMVSSAER